MADEKYVIEITIKGDDQTSKAAQASAKNLSSLAAVAKGITAAGMVVLAKKAAQAAVEVVKLGAVSLAAKDRLVAFAGGSAQAEEMMQALIDGSDGTIDRMTAMARASSLIEQGLVSNAQEMELTGAAIGKLGNQTWTTERRMASWNSMMANQSKRRLDDFGLDVAKVTARQKELVAQGKSVEEAFKLAVLDEASAKLEVLGDVSGSLTTQIGQLEAAWSNVGQVVAEANAGFVEQTGILGWLAKAMEKAAQHGRDLQEGMALAREKGLWFNADRYARDYAKAAKASRD